MTDNLTSLKWFITPISLIRHRSEDIKIPTGPDGTPAEITGKIKGWLSDMMYGRVEHPWARVVPEVQVKQ
jgi:branched-chain amino acid aminotransferase